LELVSDTRLEEARHLEHGEFVGCLGGRSKSRQGQNGQAAASTSPRSGRVRAGNNVQVFSLNELKTATRNFHMLNCVGRGGFGAVYKVRPGLVYAFFLKILALYSEDLFHRTLQIF